MEKIPSNNEKPNDVVRTLVTENYTSIESGSVEVKSAIFTIENNNEKPYIDSDILFLPGWGLNAHDETVKSFCEHIVRINKKNAHAVTTKSLDMVDSSENGIQNLENEMSAVRDYIKKHQYVSN